jgi:hypothetical protein
MRAFVAMVSDGPVQQFEFEGAVLSVLAVLSILVRTGLQLEAADSKFYRQNTARRTNEHRSNSFTVVHR